MKAILVKILPKPILKWLKLWLNAIDNAVYPIFAKTGLTSSLYYFIFSTQFRREHQAVLKGKLQYKKQLKTIDDSSVLLRRNIHRIEKGLIMKPRRCVFGEQYIIDTVVCYKSCLEAATFCNDERQWAFDVLNEYFSVVTLTTIINEAETIFKDAIAQNNTSIAFNGNVPYASEKRCKSDITPEQLYDLFKQRRSTRWYQQKPVKSSTIKQAITMALQAPSACNRQPFRFHVVSDMTLASKISSIAIGTVGFAHNIPALVVVVGDLSAYSEERDRHVPYIDAGLVSMQLMLAFESLGLSTCPINWPDIDKYERELAKELELESYLRPIMMLAVGYADEQGYIPFSQKKKAELLIKEVK